MSTARAPLRLAGPIAAALAASVCTGQTAGIDHAGHGAHTAHVAAAVRTAVLNDALVTDGGSFTIRLTTSPDPLVLNEYFDLVVEVGGDAAGGGPLQVDATASMPAHEHGMNTRPRREDLGGGRFAFPGMLFHMAGEWEITIEVARGRIRERANARLTVQ